MTSSTRIPIFDGHNDALLRLHRRTGTDAAAAFLQGEDKGHLDLPKAQRGGFAGGLFAIFVPSPRRKNATEPATPGSDPSPPAVDAATAQHVVFAMASLLYRIERQSQGRVRVCRNVGDIESCLADDVLAAVLHIEGAEAIDANFELLDADRDGKPEEIRYCDPATGQILRKEEDRNYDGTIDAWTNYQNGVVVAR